MAYFTNPYLDPNSPYNQQGQTQQTSESGLVSGDSGGGDAGQQPNSPQQGSGGQIPFTNIQKYFAANPQENSGASDLFNNEYGNKINNAATDFSNAKNIFDANVDKYGSDVSGAVESANKEFDPLKRSWIGAQDLLNTNDQNAISGYYKSMDESQNKIRSAINDYKAPDNFNYSLGQDVQEAGKKVQPGTSLSEIMQPLYRKYAGQVGAQFGAGSTALQEQLDAGNTNLSTNISNAANKYSQLNKDLTDPEGALAQSNKHLDDVKADVTNKQQGVSNALDDYYKNASQISNELNAKDWDLGPMNIKRARIKNDPFGKSAKEAYSVAQQISQNTPGTPLAGEHMPIRKNKYTQELNRLFAKYGFPGGYFQRENEPTGNEYTGRYTPI